ncbi:MAG: putative Ig domain-containing protein, partial [Planctomycetota bacterium]
VLAVLIPFVYRALSKKPTSIAVTPELSPFGVIVVEEGKQVFWRPTLTQADPSDRFELGENAPAEMTIDASTGTVRWQTTEADGPAEYRCELIVIRGSDSSQRDSDWLEIKVEEVNRPPELTEIPSQSIDLSQNNQLRVALAATDADLPAQDLTYQLGSGAPSGVQLDAKTGLLTWSVDDEFANSEWQIAYQVSDGSGQPDSQGIVRVRVTKPDPWAVAEQNLRDCLYLVVTETTPGRLLVPLGTACAIADKQLLTSASVAHGVNDARGRGWKVMAVDTRNFDLADPKGWQITKTQAHAAYVRAESIEDADRRGLQQAFFDLAILTCEQSLPKACTLGDLETDVKNDQTVACFGFPVEAGSLSPFDSLEPAFDKVEVLAVVPPPVEAAIQGRPPFLLQLVGELPFQPFGSLIVSEQGEVLAIYAFEGEVPEDIDADPVHYAVDSVHAKAFLSQKGLDLWIETQPIPPTDEDQ